MNSAKTIGFLGYLKYFFLTLFIILLLVHIVYQVYEQKSAIPVIKDLGGRFLLVTNNLDAASKQIIEQGAVYKPTPDFWTGVYGLFNTLSSFFTSFYIIYIWLWILTVFFSFLLFGGNKNVSGLILALIVFFGLQAVLIISVAGIDKQIDCFSNCEKSIENYILTPILCFWDFFRAILLVGKPLDDISSLEPYNYTPQLNLSLSPSS